MCKHTAVKQVVFPELWVLQRFKTTKVTFSLTQGHWQSFHWIGNSLTYTYATQLQCGTPQLHTAI